VVRQILGNKKFRLAGLLVVLGFCVARTCWAQSIDQTASSFDDIASKVQTFLAGWVARIIAVILLISGALALRNEKKGAAMACAIALAAILLIPVFLGMIGGGK